MFVRLGKHVHIWLLTMLLAGCGGSANTATSSGAQQAVAEDFARAIVETGDVAAALRLADETMVDSLHGFSRDNRKARLRLEDPWPTGSCSDIAFFTRAEGACFCFRVIGEPVPTSTPGVLTVSYGEVDVVLSDGAEPRVVDFSYLGGVRSAPAKAIEETPTTFTACPSP
jgi:hypothetical protein